NRADMKFMIEQSVRIIETGSLAAILLRLWGLVGIVVVAQPDIDHQVLAHAVIVLREDTEFIQIRRVLAVAEGNTDGAGSIGQQLRQRVELEYRILWIGAVAALAKIIAAEFQRMLAH